VVRFATAHPQGVEWMKDHKVTDKKKIREIIGYTHQKQRDNADLWYKNSFSFYEASIVLQSKAEGSTLDMGHS
jgi:predicted nucleic acid-binding protein